MTSTTPTRRRCALTVAASAFALAALASVPAAAKPATGARSCSAAGLDATLPQQALPAKVASIRKQIARAAIACDYATLEKLARENGRIFTFTYSAVFRSPAAYWRRLEANGREKPLAKLVKLLKLRVTKERSLYFWPAAHRKNATRADWAELRTIYSQAELDRMRRQGTGYVGYRVGITSSGDWQYFVAGD